MGANRRLLHGPRPSRLTHSGPASSPTTARSLVRSVNQFFYSNAFREHAARFAHQLDAAMGHHTLGSADERERLAVWNTMTAMIGSAARRYAEWNEIDPEALIVGGNFDGTPRWRRDLDDYIAVDEALCGQCDIATFARRFYLKADLTEFARLWRQGIVYRADRTTTPWSPEIFDVAQSPHGEFYDELTAFFYLGAFMLEHATSYGLLHLIDSSIQHRIEKRVNSMS